MKQVRKRLTYANVMSSLAVFMVLSGGAAIASNHILPKNSVGTKQLKKNAVKANKLAPKAVKTAKLAPGAVKAGKLAKNSVATAKIRNGAVTGPKINVSTLGEVPSAATAGTASSLAGQIPFYFRLGFGESRTIASHGVVSLVAVCRQDGGTDYAEILMQTSQNGAVANGEDDFDGNTASDYLNVDTAAEDREFVYASANTGETEAPEHYDEGYVIGPDGKMLTANSEGFATVLNYGQPGCLFAGIVNALG